METLFQEILQHESSSLSVVQAWSKYIELNSLNHWKSWKVEIFYFTFDIDDEILLLLSNIHNEILKINSNMVWQQFLETQI